MLKKLFSFLKNSKEAKNSGWLIGGKVAQMVLTFVVGIFTTRFLGPDNYGTINYALAYVSFVSAFCTLGINSVIIKDFHDHPEEQGTAIGTALLLRTASSLMAAAAMVGVSAILDRGEKLTIAVVALTGISVVFQVADTINYWFQSRYQSKVTAAAALIAYAVTSAYRIILLALGKSVYWFAFATSVDYICVAVFLFAAYRKYKGPSLHFSFDKAKSLLGKSYHYILSGMMVSIYGATDRLMLKQMMDEATVGYYSLASALNLMWVFVLAAIIDSMYPTIISLHSESKEAFERKNRQLYAIVIYVSIAAAIGFFTLGKPIIVLLYGAEYAPAALPLKIITWYTIFSYLGVARNAWIVCEDQQKYLKYMYLSAAVINVFLNLLFIPRFGGAGAAAASLITQICTSIILPCFIKSMRPNVKLMAEAFLLRGIR